VHPVYLRESLDVGTSNSIPDNISSGPVIVKTHAYMLPKLIVISMFNLVKVVLVQLAYETGKIGMLEHAW
jgi:hypothetical protein